MTQEEKIRDLEERLALIKVDNSRLLEGLRQSKKAASGYKGKNVQFQNELKSLKQQKENLEARIEHYKQLDLEGDELNEKRIVEIEEKNKVIDGLQAQVQELAAKNAELVSKLNANQDIIDELELTVAELKTPWWKKIFS